MLSFWEKQSFVHYDYIVVGAGIVGLSTAISLREKNKNARIAVLERGLLPTGGSTKNAGFACFGSLTELLADMEAMGEDKMLDLVTQRWEGLRRLRMRLGDDLLDYKHYGGFELIGEKETAALASMERVNDVLRPLFGVDVFSLRNQLAANFGFAPGHVKALVYNEFEGQIDTGKMMKNLALLAGRKGIETFTGCQVQGFDEGDTVKVEVRQERGTMAFHTQKLIFCTSSFTQKFFPQFELEPGRGQVLVTKPIDGLKFKGAFHFDEGYFYFRDYYGRVIFGGGRNLDFEKERTYDLETNKMIVDELIKKLQEVILPGQTFEVDHNWAGLMDFGKHKQPLTEKLSDRVFAGARLSGMGVAIGSLMGEKLAAMAT